MGLFDALQGADNVFAMGLLDAAAPKPVRTNIGAGLMQAMSQAQAWQQAQEDRRQKAAMQAMQMGLMGAQLDETKAQASQRAAAIEDAKRKAMESAALRARQQQFLANPGGMAGAGGPSIMAGSGQRSPDQNAQAAAAAQQPRFDFGTAAALFGPEQAIKLMGGMNDARNFGLQEVARTAETAMPGSNSPGTLQLDKFGRPVGRALPKAVEMKLANLGGSELAYNPFELSAGQQMRRTQSPDSAASNAVAWANYGLAKDKQAQDANAGQLIETPNGYVRVGKDNRTTPIFAPGGQMQPLMGKGAGLTEDQGKATGWLVQAQNAYKNMLESGFDSFGQPKEAAYPGVNDALATFPGMEPLANWMRSPDRQKFIQASQSLSEALLRAATGAGVSKDEAEQKVRELVPLFGEDADTTKQKMDSIPMYIESLKVRAGPGASKAAMIGASWQPKIKFLGFEK